MPAARVSSARRSLYTLDDLDDLTDEDLRRRARKQRIIDIIKITIFCIVWVFFTILLIITKPHDLHEIVVPVQPQKPHVIILDEQPNGHEIGIVLVGFIDTDATMNPSSVKDNQAYIIVTVARHNAKANQTEWTSSEWRIYFDLDMTKTETLSKYFKVDEKWKPDDDDEDIEWQVSVLNHHTELIAISLTINANPLNEDKGVLIGLILLIFLYVLIIWDITDRTFAAILCATTAIGCLCILGARPSLETIISWIDMQTLMLLFAMMIMVAVLAETGVFDYLSVFAYQMSKGRTWLLLFYLFMFTGIFSAFLDNVTIVLLMVPVTIRLCEALALRTTLVLISIALFSNIGGTLTPVGDPPNVIIATDHYVIEKGIKFGYFTYHMLPGVFICMILSYIMLYFMIRNKLFSAKAQMLDSIKELQKLADKSPEKDSLMNRDIMKRIEELKDRIKYQDLHAAQPAASFEETLAEMQSKYKIRDMSLLIRCCIAMGFAILLFFLHSLPAMAGVTLCWAAMIAALLLLILANKPDVDTVLSHVEWSTLVFFAALFVFMEALVEMGLMDWIGQRTIEIILSVDKSHQLTVAILLLLWISALTSAFVDNIPVTTMLLKLTIRLAKNDKLALPLAPLIWALSYGACFGGNGTLIGASANVVTAGIATQYGYNITFKSFFMVGFPIMIMTVFVATAYLLVAHCLFHWHHQQGFD